MSTPKNKMDMARELIKAKDYDAARAILRTVNHPTAAEWVSKIDKLSPPKASAIEMHQAQSKDFTNASIVVLVLYFVLWFPGLIANAIYYNEAKRVAYLTGERPHGMDTLRWELIIFAWTPLTLLLIFAVLVIVSYLTRPT